MAIYSLNPPGNRAIVSEKPHNPWHRRDHTCYNVTPFSESASRPNGFHMG